MPAASNDRYRPLVDAFEAIVADGAPAALVARRGSAILVEAAAGTQAGGQPFTSTTPVFLYSAVKPVAALTVLIAGAEGAIALDAPVASLWPSFGAHGKDHVTVAQALAHGAAVPGWRERITVAGLADRAAAAEALAADEPWWEPGEPGEHAFSYGHLLDAILRKATGRDIAFWWERTALRTGITIDLVAGSGVRRPAPLEDPGGAWLRSWDTTPGLLGRLLRSTEALLDVDVVNSVAGRTLIAPAVTGYGSAADLAALWSWWPSHAAAETCGADLHARLNAPALEGYDHVLERDVSWGLGPQFEPDGSYGMGGIGGCVGWYEPALDLAIGFTTPRVGPLELLDPLDDAILTLRESAA